MPSWNIGSKAGRVRLSIERAESSHWSLVLLKHVSVEEAASVGAVSSTSDSTILDVLSLSVGSADLWVEWTWEELLADAGRWLRVSTLALLWVGPSWWCNWGGGVRLSVAVGTSDDDLELLASLTGVGGGASVDGGTPECTLVVGQGVGVRAAKLSGWVQSWVTLDVDVE